MPYVYMTGEDLYSFREMQFQTVRTFVLKKPTWGEARKLYDQAKNQKENGVMEVNLSEVEFENLKTLLAKKEVALEVKLYSSVDATRQIKVDEVPAAQAEILSQKERRMQEEVSTLRQPSTPEVKEPAPPEQKDKYQKGVYYMSKDDLRNFAREQVQLYRTGYLTGNQRGAEDFFHKYKDLHGEDLVPVDLTPKQLENYDKIKGNTKLLERERIFISEDGQNLVLHTLPTQRQVERKIDEAQSLLSEMQRSLPPSSGVSNVETKKPDIEKKFSLCESILKWLTLNKSAATVDQTNKISRLSTLFQTLQTKFSGLFHKENQKKESTKEHHEENSRRSTPR